MKIKKLICTLLTAVIGLTILAVPVSAATPVYGNKAPYARSWLDAINDYEVIDYYEYSAIDNAYAKTSTIIYKGTRAYYKTTDTVLSTEVFNNQIGFDYYGNIWFVNSNYKLLYCAKSSKTPSVYTDAAALLIDDNGFVTGYVYNNIQYYFNGTNNGNNGNNGNNSGNNNGNWNTWPGNPTTTYPYITFEDNKLVFVESTEEQHSLYVENGYLIMNNIILYKQKVTSFGFTKTGVAYINGDNKLVTYKFGDKKQYVKSKNVTSLTLGLDGFVTGYSKDGVSYSL